MDMKTLKEFMNSSNSIYLILPPVALWAVTPFFETGAMFAVCLGIAAIAFALLAVKDYYDERHTNPWLKTKPEADRPNAPYEAGMVDTILKEVSKRFQFQFLIKMKGCLK